MFVLFVQLIWINPPENNISSFASYIDSSLSTSLLFSNGMAITSPRFRHRNVNCPLGVTSALSVCLISVKHSEGLKDFYCFDSAQVIRFSVLSSVLSGN